MASILVAASTCTRRARALRVARTSSTRPLPGAAAGAPQQPLGTTEPHAWACELLPGWAAPLLTPTSARPRTLLREPWDACSPAVRRGAAVGSRRRDGTAGLVGGSVGLLGASRTLPHPAEAVGGKKVIAWTLGTAAMAVVTSAALRATEMGSRGSFSRPNRPYRLTWHVLAVPVTNFRDGVRSAVKSAVKLPRCGATPRRDGLMCS